MIVLIICSIIILILLLINKKVFKYVAVFINILLIMLIIYYYHNHLISVDTFKFINHNIYFYFLNTIMFLILCSIFLFKCERDIIIIIIYIIIFCFVSFSLFITHYLHNNTLIVVGNIYPMIVMGNYLCFIFYFYLLVKLVRFLTKKK